MTGRRLSSRAQLEGPIVSGAPFKPQPIVYGQARDQAVDTMAKRVLSTYLAATPQQRKEGERWYGQAHGVARAIAGGYDPDEAVGQLLRSMPTPARQRSELPSGPSEQLPETVHRKEYEQRVNRAAGSIARLSPQTPWPVNVRQAHEVSQMSGEDVAKLKQDDRSVLKGKALNRQPTSNILAAQAIMHGEVEPEEALPQGKKRVKVSSFASNMARPDSPEGHVTVDFRAADIAHGRLLNTSTNRGLSSPGRYRQYEQAYQQAAELANREHPELRHQRSPLSPMQMQAIAWVADQEDVDRRLGGVARGGHLHAKGGKPLTRSDLGSPLGQQLNQQQFGSSR